MKTQEWLVLETLNVVKRVLTKGEAKNSFVNQRIINSKKSLNARRVRKPTIKEMAKHTKLLRKQRARLGGV